MPDASKKQYTVCLRVEHAYATNERPVWGQTWTMSVEASSAEEAVEKAKKASLAAGAELEP